MKLTPTTPTPESEGADAEGMFGWPEDGSGSFEPAGGRCHVSGPGRATHAPFFPYIAPPCGSLDSDHHRSQLPPSILEKLGLRRTVSDACLFMGKDILVLMHVDDFQILSPSLKKVDWLIKSMRKTYNIKLVDTNLFLGLHITENQKTHSMKVSQQHYSKDKLKGHNLENAKGRHHHGSSGSPRKVKAWRPKWPRCETWGQLGRQAPSFGATQANIGVHVVHREDLHGSSRLSVENISKSRIVYVIGWA